MSSFKSLDVVLPTQLSESITKQDPFFKKFNYKQIFKHSGRIGHISFGPSSPYDMAVCSHTRVHIYDTNTMKIKKNLTRFTTTVTCASIRDDGQMVAAASQNGTVQLFDVNSRSILRTFSDHQTAAHLVTFLGDGTKLLTGSDDKTAKIYDIATEKLLYNLTCHTDSVRCGFESTLSRDVIVTGSYDHSICFTDLRMPSHASSITPNGAVNSVNTVTRLDHGAPVSSLVMFPNSGIVASAGDQYIRCYDMLQSNSSDHIVKDLKYHQKGITSLAIDIKSQQLLSSSLDGFIKFYDAKHFLLVHSVSYNEPLLSVAFSPDSSILSIGAVGGNVHIAKKMSKTDLLNDNNNNSIDNNIENDALPYSGPSFRMTDRQKHFIGGVKYKANKDVDIEVGNDIHNRQRAKLQEFDVRLKNFQHGPALDAALQTSSPATICAMVEELQSRGALRVALQNRDDAALEPILKFTLRYMNNPQYSNYVVTLIHAILDVYTPAVGQSTMIDEILLKMDEMLISEIEFQRDCFQLLGEVDMFIHTNSHTNNSEIQHQQNYMRKKINQKK